MSQDILQRYRGLLKAIESASESTSEAGRPSLETNLFCIPAVSKNGALRLANYNSKLSSSYRNSLARVVGSESTRTELLGSSGPFLVSTVRPLAHTGEGSHLLVFDLTSMSAEHMDEIVKFYEQRIAEKGASDFDFFDDLRLELIRLKPSPEDVKRYIDIATIILPLML